MELVLHRLFAFSLTTTVLLAGFLQGTPTPAEEPAASPQVPALPAAIPATWLTYHLAHPGPGGAMPGDPNPAYFYKGRYHLHYIYNAPKGFAYAHVSSPDMVHWTWHPTVLEPGFTSRMPRASRRRCDTGIPTAG